MSRVFSNGSASERRAACGFALVALLIVIAILRTTGPGDESSTATRPARTTAFSQPTDLAGAASRGTELSSSLGLEARYLIFEWVRNGRPSRGECISVAQER